MIVNLRGASGAGKTTTAYQLLKAFPNEALYVPTYKLHSDGVIREDGKPRAPRAFRLPGDLYVIGRYTGAACSGCDGWKPAVVDKTVRYYADRGHVFFESLIMSSSKGPWLRFSEDYPGQLVFAYLDTDADTCIEQVYKRNGGKPINEYDLRSHWRSIQSQRARLADAGERTVTITRNAALEELVQLFRSGGWNPEASTFFDDEELPF